MAARFILKLDDQKKSQALEMFKIFQTEVEKQLEKRITIVRSNRRDEYYGQHEENATGNENFIFEEEGDAAVIENAKQDVTPLIPLSETVLENSQFEEPIKPQEQAVENPDLDDPQEPIQPMRSDRPRISIANSDYKVPLAKGDLKEYCPKNKEEEDEMRNKSYASLVGSIMYAQVCTRLDLALCISKMGRFQSNPGMQHWIAEKKVLRNFIKDIKVVDSISRTMQIYNDNTVVVFHCMNNKMSSRLHHIDIKYLIVREKVAVKLVRFDHIRTQDMIADPFTKFCLQKLF
ncbi:unnamed protein product [Prunus brigantina]